MSSSLLQNCSLPYNNPQVPLSNSFIPLRKPSHNSSSNHPSSSTSTSSPSIPPGFENFIPPPLKAQREQKRLRKIQKKRMRRQEALSRNPLSSQDTDHNNTIADEIIELGLKLGMNFNGPLSDLHGQILAILSRQQ